MGVLAFLCFLIELIVVIAGDLSASYFEQNSKYWSTYYIKPYARMPVFLIGIMMGCMHYSQKYEHPQASNLASIATNFKYNSMFRTLATVVGFCLTFLVVLFFQMINKSKNVDGAWDTLFIIWSRPIFTIGVILIVYPCILGYGAFKNFTTHAFWLPFSRLTYGVFLCHSTFIIFREYNTDRGQWGSYFDTWLFFLAYTLLSYLFSLFTFLLVEAPFAKIEADFFYGSFLSEQQQKEAILKEERERKIIEEGNRPPRYE
jgi:peptidoglycan/LPS O-acetylase OafA/YrhL